MDALQIDHVLKLMRSIKFSMVTSQGSDGELMSRPLTTQQIDGSKVLFLVPEDSKICADVRINSQVNLAYAEPQESAYISVTGRAAVRDDRFIIKELWNSMNQAWFPEGPTDPKIRLLAVDIEKLEYWESTETKLTKMFEFAKALVNGQQPHIGKHGLAKIHPVTGLTL